MQVSRRGEFYVVSRITGPTHNFLGLRFGGVGDCILSQKWVQSNFQQCVEPELVRREVLAAVAEANAKWSTNYTVAEVEFVGDDTPIYRAYRMLANLLIERMHSDLLSSEPTSDK